MTAAATAPSGAARRGATRLTATALTRLVSAVAGDALGVDAGSVSVDLGDRAGSLTLRISAPMRAPSLARVRAEHTSIERSGGPILERIEDAKVTIRDRVEHLTDSRVARVMLRVTGLNIMAEERVR